MVQIHLGCAGWAYPDWKGGFYPTKLPSGQFLKHYSQHFSFTEINTTFYNIPSFETVKSWYSQVPETFQFSIKLWQKITHDPDNEELENRINLFFSRLKPLFPKISLFLLQFPPKFSYSDKNWQKLQKIGKTLPPLKPYVLELRDNSWLNHEMSSQIHNYPGINLTTSYLEGFIPYYPQEQKIYYIRLIGDRTLTQFTHIQREQKTIMNDLIQKIRELERTPNLTDIFVIFNNHFRGFAPKDVIDMAESLGIRHRPLSPQNSLDKFLTEKKTQFRF